MIRINGVDKESTLRETSAEAHGAYYLADNPNLYEPQRTNHFELVVPGLDNIIKMGMTGTEANSKIANGSEVLRLSVESATIPSFSLGEIAIRMGNSVMYAAGSPEFSAGTIVCKDYIGAESKEVLYAWLGCAYDPETDKIGTLSDYKKDAYLIEYTPDYQKVRQYVLKGCWVTSVTESDRNKEDTAEASKVTASIRYDKGYIDRSSQN